jgi:hypothetical protein
MSEVHSRHPRTTMKKKKNRLCLVAAADENPLINSTYLQLFKRSDASGSRNCRCPSPQNNKLQNDPDEKKKYYDTKNK